MSDLDSELRAAVSESEAAAVPVASVEHKGAADGGLVTDPPASSGSRSGAKRGAALLLALLVMGGGILTLVVSSADEAAVYSVTTDLLVTQKDRYAGRNVRVEGDLVKGSLRHRAEPCEYRFNMSRGGKEIAVRYAECVVPDTFRDAPDTDVQVTAEGKLTAEGYFEASHIMAKCPSKYEMQQRKANGEAMPHAAMGGPAAAAPADVN